MPSSPDLWLELRRSAWPLPFRLAVLVLVLQLYWWIPIPVATLALLLAVLLLKRHPLAPPAITLLARDHSVLVEGDPDLRPLQQAQPFCGCLALRLRGADLWLWPDMLDRSQWAALRSWLRLHRPGVQRLPTAPGQP